MSTILPKIKQSSISKSSLIVMENSTYENIERTKSLLQSARRVLILTGAGISAESGVPTFRGGGGAPVWRGMPFEQLSSAQMVEKDLPLVWEWFDYRRGKVSECEPNAAHKTLADIQQSGRFEEFSIVTQNIDGLHQAAGSKEVIELHGSLWQARCLSCKTKQNLRDIPEDERPPVCPECLDSMRPDVILFGEAMSMDAFAQAKFFAEVCDVCIVIGTSALVYPAAELPLIAKQIGAKVIEINPEETQLSAQADLSIRGKAAEIVPLIFVENDDNNDRLPTSEIIKNTAEQNRGDFQNELPNGESETESLAAENQSVSQNEMTSDSHPLRVDFVHSEEFPVLSRLGMTFAPGKKQKGAVSGDWNRNMYRDMLRLREHYAVDLQISLLEEEEFNELGLDGFEGQSQRRGISLIKFPIRDVSVPTSMKNFAKVIREIVRRLNDGEKVVVHCKGGLGRTGLTAACAIVAASRSRISSTEAIKMVRQARHGAVETSQQENFVALFEEYWQIYSERIESLLYQQKTAVSEKILEIKSKGLIERLFRFPAYDGRYFFYLTVQYPHSPNNDNYDWKAEPVPTFQEALDLLHTCQFLPYKTPFIHPEYQTEFKSFLEKIIKDFSGSFIFEEWLAGLDDPAAREHNVINSGDDNEERKSNVEINRSKRPGELSDKHFLLYWQERNVRDHEASGYPLDVVSSRQLKRCKPGDTLWLTTINQAGELILAGRLRIGEIVDHQTAVRRLNDTSLWDGGFFALPKEAGAEVLREINLGETALDIRFANLESDRFILKNGKINAQQLQTMRELTDDSAEMLAGIWEIEEKEENNDDFEDNLDVKFFRQLVREEPLNAGLHYKLGFHCSNHDDLLEESNAAYRRAIELAPNLGIAYEGLGRNYLRAGEPDKAKQAFKDAIRLEPGSSENRFMLGLVYAEMRDYEKAIAVTKEGLKYGPASAWACFNVGNFYFHLQNYEKAVPWLEKSAEIDEFVHPKTFYWLGKCYRHLGEKQKEFHAYRKAIETGVNNLGIDYVQFLYFDMGLASLAIGNLNEARERQADLRKVDERLANELQSFIDRYESENEETKVAVKEIEAKNAGRKREPIEFYINGKSFEAKNVPEMYQKALEYMVEARLLDDVSLPIAAGEKRYILAKEAVHPIGKPFLAPVEYKGFFMEAHNNRVAAIAQLEKLIKRIGCTFHHSCLNELANRINEHEMDIEQIGTYIWVELEEGNISGVEHFLEEIGESRMFEEWIAEAKQKAEQEEKPKNQGFSSIKQISKVNVFRGCLLGGAVGDALGAAIEFDSIQAIRQKFGEQGLTDYAPAYGRIGAITDDTQMTLFTAEGLLRAATRGNHKGICHPPTIIYHAYLRWLETQGEKINNEQVKRWVYDEKSWLRDLPELNSRRAPGNSCLSALQSGKMGTIEEPINNSKGCGGVMRVAPIGLASLDPFRSACEAAAITHGHPTGYLSSGVLALIISKIVSGTSLTDAINHAVYEELPLHAGYEETFAACDQAIKLATDKSIQPSPETVESLGGGWIAEEALAIAVYCSLACENDFKKAILLAVNHSGDSDSTGAITGNILGALCGADAIPHYWLERLELKEAIVEIAEDLLVGFKTGDDWWSKYPGI